MKKTKLVHIFLTIFWILPFLYGQSYARDLTTVRARGVADTSNGNYARARDLAIADALRRCVEQAIGTFIAGETVIENEKILKDSIYTNSRGYVSDYLVISESSDAKLYEVEIEAQISSAKLKDDLAGIGLLMNRKHKPRIMVVIQEEHLSRKVPDPAGETEIIRKLIDKGFEVVDQGQVTKIRYNNQVQAAIDGNLKLAAKIGASNGAEILIIGEAFSEAARGITGGLISCRARVEARVIRTDTGKIIYADGKTAGDLDTTEAIAGKKALRKAGGKLADTVVNEILAKWQDDVTNTASVVLVIEGLDFKSLIQLKNKIRSTVRGIQNIHERSFSANRAVWEIDLKGDAQYLSEELVTRDFKPFLIDIKNFSANKITIACRRNG